jgi:hypothetical protein
VEATSLQERAAAYQAALGPAGVLLQRALVGGGGVDVAAGAGVGSSGGVEARGSTPDMQPAAGDGAQSLLLVFHTAARDTLAMLRPCCDAAMMRLPEGCVGVQLDDVGANLLAVAVEPPGDLLAKMRRALAELPRLGTQERAVFGLCCPSSVVQAAAMAAAAAGLCCGTVRAWARCISMRGAGAGEQHVALEGLLPPLPGWLEAVKAGVVHSTGLLRSNAPADIHVDQLQPQRTHAPSSAGAGACALRTGTKALGSMQGHRSTTPEAYQAR